MLRNVKGFENIKINAVEEVQRLWKNQGKIVRLHIESPTQSQNTIIVKYINPTDDGTVSSQRKIKKKYWNVFEVRFQNSKKFLRQIHYFKKSYEIEQKFYEHYSDEISHQESTCKVPKCFGSSQDGTQVGYHYTFDFRFIQKFALGGGPKYSQKIRLIIFLRELLFWKIFPSIIRD